jgi:quinoprotein glucose dehydrogenase
MKPAIMSPHAQRPIVLGRPAGSRYLVHHGLWDYDLPAAPNLVDITVAGKPIKAAAQVTKQGFCFVFDRVTGEPIWPIEERPVLQSTVPGEKSSPMQPFPSRPTPFERQGLSEEDVIDFTPELRQAGAIVAEIALPDNVNGAPMTYMAGGRQYIVVAVGGANLPVELIALRLP